LAIIDLRSDTVTVPTPAMRAAMAAAEVGDDVYGEDPTVRRLEELAAERVGMEAALFVPSGTMGNQLAVLSHCARGEELYAEETAHIYLNECGGPAVLAGVSVRPLSGQRGRFTPETLRAAVRPADVHYPPPRLVCLENTHNRAGGTVWPLAAIAAVAAEARHLGLAVHMDGARLFNAAVALGVPAARICAPLDSVMFCVSKGLAAPVGSLLCGRADFVARARRYRKLLGGGMRQAGVLAAAGIVALEQMVDRLAEDHANARRLAEGLAAVPGLRVDPGAVETNMVMVDLVAPAPAPAEVAAALRSRGVICGGEGRRWRLVTHKDVDRAGVEQAIAAFAAVMRGAA
jgi:threonine aldolase